MSKNYSIDSLKEIAGGDTEFMTVVAQTFLDEIPPDLASMEEAVANDNRELAYQFAHKMKPNLEMFGIELQKEISSIESWSKSSKSKEVVLEQLEKIVAILKLVFAELKSDFKL
ncbi:Hpt domain-containing protein [Ulvibacter antarcticus]|uniref:HPt (Histidine-containing phosphotransfer) domain-containing protein n=1 Tax=Ulvibacter antarcticus TaxID=442714 RepID=A0A3L9YGD4_9FLAO|nr:Hpt domain-containing protein [Ulvibacter antarcticus]RMA58490.1 HPt (histidine-containing phosphotransfer) domain-containing protein [Ulvibacter antarcticus]